MKKLLITALVCLFVCGISTTAKATVLTAGTSAPITPAYPTLGSFVTTISQPFTYDSINGIVTQDIYSNPTGLLFLYQVQNLNTSLGAPARMTVTNYAGFTTDADAYLGSELGASIPLNMVVGADLAHFVSRDLTSNSLGYQFAQNAPINDPGLMPNTTSGIMWIQTNAQFYGPGVANFINGGIVDVPVYGPVVPEPATMMLLGMGILGVFGLRRKTA